MKYAPIALAAMLVATPAASGTLDTVKGALDKADQKAQDVIEGSAFEKFFASFFGLAYVGGAWVGLCDRVGGEWVSLGDGEYAPGECKRDLMK